MDFPEKFKNVKAVLDFLKLHGFKIQKSKIYEDAREGLLRVQDNKFVFGADAKLYSATLKKDELNFEPAELTAEKLKKGSLRLDLQNEKLKFEIDRLLGKYMPKADFERELAARGAVLDNGLRRNFAIRAQDFIVLVGGRLSKTPDVIDYFNKILDEQMNAFATTESFQVMVIGEDESV